MKTLSNTLNESVSSKLNESESLDIKYIFDTLKKEIINHENVIKDLKGSISSLERMGILNDKKLILDESDSYFKRGMFGTQSLDYDKIIDFFGKKRNGVSFSAYPYNFRIETYGDKEVRAVTIAVSESMVGGTDFNYKIYIKQ